MSMTVPRFSRDSITNIEFLIDYQLKNEAFIIDSTFTKDWLAIKKWRTDEGKPNLDFLHREYGNADVPVLVGKNACEHQIMKFREFIDNFLTEKSNVVAYIKDWHFQSVFEHDKVYVLPAFLLPDLINNERWSTVEDNPFSGDYRFVYFGTAGSWTKFHSDALNSFSWSANVCGRKLWYLLRPGQEKYFSYGNGYFIEDIREMRGKWSEAGVIEFVQEPGEIIFVPSEWYHQVHNLEISLSINHNVINACNINRLYYFIERRLADVKKEIEDTRSIFTVREFSEQCEKILLADCRLNVSRLINFLNLVYDDRFAMVCPDVCERFKQFNFDDSLLNQLDELKSVLKNFCQCKNNENFCNNCAKFLLFFEMKRSEKLLANKPLTFYTFCLLAEIV